MCVGVDVLFGEVDVSLGCAVDLDALAGAGTDVASDDDEGAWIACVPYALFGLEISWREGEFEGWKTAGGPGRGRWGTWMACFKWCQ